MDFARVATGYDFLEGPRPDGRGGLYYTSNLGCHWLSPSGAVTDLTGARGCGGIALHEHGGIVISGPTLALWRDGVLTPLWQPDDIMSINDIFTTPEGAVLAGTVRGDTFDETTGTGRDGELWEVTSPGIAREVYGGVGFTNGIGLSPDGSTIYHSDSFKHRVLVHTRDGEHLRTIDIDRPGIPDGLVVDESGALWVAFYRGGRIERMTPDGDLLETHAMPANNVTSLAFDDDRLYVVTCDSTDDPSLKGCVWVADADVRGVPATPAAI